MTKAVFVTGAASGTGYAIAEKFAKEGYNVAISSREIAEAREAAKIISEKYNVKSKGYKLELTDTNEIKSVFKKGYSLNGKMLRYAQVVVIK